MLFCALLLLFSITNLHAYNYKHTIKTYTDTIPRNIECHLAADIGGTNTNIGIFEVGDDNKANLLISMHTKTTNIGNFTEVMNEILQYLQNKYEITVNHACIAAPGVATKDKDHSKVHGLLDIDRKELIEKTPLKTAIIVNDLFVVGLGLKALNPSNIVQLYGAPQEENKSEIRGIISAGTGIGSSTVTWDNKAEEYVAHAGEGGLLEFAPTNALEYAFANHIQNFYGRKATYWANLASGSGITRIYSMLKLMNKYNDSLHLDDHKPKTILNNQQDELCKATADLFFKFFGRFTRNYVWSALPYNGLYIIGGLPCNHSQLFIEKFAANYEDPRFYNELKDIPIYLVTDSNVGLHGAINYLLREMKKQQANSQTDSPTSPTA